MPLNKLKPGTPGQRGTIRVVDPNLHRGAPHRTLVESKNVIDGRNNQGRMTVRQRGGGHKRKYRLVDFRRNKDGIPAKVERLEYDPNRSANIALLLYADGERRYILAPRNVSQGAKLVSGSHAPIAPGNALPLRNIPVGSVVHCVEMKPGKGGQLCRSAGSYARLTNKEGKYATLVMPSGEIRRVLVECRATIGSVGNTDHSQRRLGKAGKSRHLGRRPKTRGVAMSHDAHPLGGGEGRSKGNRAPVSKTGVFSKGGPTRNRKQRSEDLIIRRRKSKRYGQLK